jgi:hypothetical protein
MPRAEESLTPLNQSVDSATVQGGGDDGAPQPLPEGVAPASGLTWQPTGAGDRGRSLAYRQFCAENPSGVVFWTHGVGAHCHQAENTKFGEACVASGLSCFMMDLQGHVRQQPSYT